MLVNPELKPVSFQTSEKGRKQLVPTQNEHVKRESHYRMCHKIKKM